MSYLSSVSKESPILIFLTGLLILAIIIIIILLFTNTINNTIGYILIPTLLVCASVLFAEACIFFKDANNVKISQKNWHIVSPILTPMREKEQNEKNIIYDRKSRDIDMCQEYINLYETLSKDISEKINGIDTVVTKNNLTQEDKDHIISKLNEYREECLKNSNRYKKMKLMLEILYKITNDLNKVNQRQDNTNEGQSQDNTNEGQSHDNTKEGQSQDNTKEGQIKYTFKTRLIEQKEIIEKNIEKYRNMKGTKEGTSDLPAKDIATIYEYIVKELKYLLGQINIEIIITDKGSSENHILESSVSYSSLDDIDNNRFNWDINKRFFKIQISPMNKTVL